MISLLAAHAPLWGRLLATASDETAPAGPGAGYSPFLTPLPVWSDRAWPWLLLPLCIGVALVYKSIKCQKMSQVPKEAAVLTAWIVFGMGAAAVVLMVIVEAIERSNG